MTSMFAMAHAHRTFHSSVIGTLDMLLAYPLFGMTSTLSEARPTSFKMIRNQLAVLGPAPLDQCLQDGLRNESRNNGKRN